MSWKAVAVLGILVAGAVTAGALGQMNLASALGGAAAMSVPNTLLGMKKRVE